MKFCKKLQKVAGCADPEWAPYWMNYKLMKKLIKNLRASGTDANCSHPDSNSAPKVEWFCIVGETTTGDESQTRTSGRSDVRKISTEAEFFQIVHSELEKVTRFFEAALREMAIREDRVRVGFKLLQHHNPTLVDTKWITHAKCSLRLHKQLLQLEAFAIMAYCSFSKILKKHDKVTGQMTRVAFMEGIVESSNISHYPDLLELIARCETHCERVSETLAAEHTTTLLCDDERLFIETIHRLRGESRVQSIEQVGERKLLPARVEDGASDSDCPDDDEKSVDSSQFHGLQLKARRNRATGLRLLPFSTRLSSSEDPDVSEDSKPPARKMSRLVSSLQSSRGKKD